MSEYQSSIPLMHSALHARGIRAETWHTGGGCLAVVATTSAGAFDVVFTCLDEDGVIGTYHNDPAEPHMWYVEDAAGPLHVFDTLQDFNGNDLPANIDLMADTFAVEYRRLNGASVLGRGAARADMRASGIAC